MFVPPGQLLLASFLWLFTSLLRFSALNFSECKFMADAMARSELHDIELEKVH
jgi:hypothetical protein